MRKFAYALLALAAMSTAAVAQPTKMDDSQLADTSAGFFNTTWNWSNVSLTQVNALTAYSFNAALIFSNSPVKIKF